MIPHVAFKDAQDVDDPHHSVYLKFLWELLIERLQEPDSNISHTSMPLWEDHVAFVIKESEYRAHWVMVNEHDRKCCIGTIYLTYNNEIGIHIAKRYQRQGYGSYALKIFLEQFHGKYYANINPNNRRSIEFFKRHGFNLLQHTYMIMNQPDEISEHEPK